MTGWSSARYTLRPAAEIVVGTRVVIDKDGQGTYRGLADVTDITTTQHGSILAALWTGKRTIYRRWAWNWDIKVATPL
jgi:hypothetical protein